jgi:serine/threonine-protein kinase
MAVIGTAGCMAPEQAAGDRDIDARADIYSVGVVLYQMLTGRVPYEGETFYRWVEKVTRNDPFPRPRELRPEIPQVWEDVILEMLQVDRANRPESMREVAQRIARGVPDGTMLLRMLAPRLRADIPLGPGAVTMIGANPAYAFSESAIQHPPPPLTTPAQPATVSLRPPPSPPALPKRSPLSLPSLALMAAGIAIGGVVMKLASGRHDAAPTAAAGSIDARTPVSGMAAPAVDASDVMLPHDAYALPDAATAVTTPADAQVAASTGVDAASGDAGAPVHVPPQAAGSGMPPHPDRPRPRVEPGQLATTGTLVVKVSPRAEVYIDDGYVGTTPVMKLLSVGSHHLRLVGATKQDDSNVTIGPGKTTTVSRTW